jgi:hypothetical protein
METPLDLASNNDPALLEQVPVNVRPSNTSIRVKTDSDKLAES